MKEEYISITEFAKRAGVSRQAIQQRLDTSLRDFVKVEQGKKSLNINGLRLFDGASLAQGFVKACQGSNGIDQAVIEILRGELSAKNKQIEKLQEENFRLTEALENTTASLKAAQALHAGTMQQQLISSSVEDTSNKKEEPIETEIQKKWYEFWK